MPLKEVFNPLSGNFDLVNTSEVFNVKDYGAIGNGTTDDTAAINLALTAARATGGAVRGNLQYLISAPLIISSDTVLDMTGATITLASGSHSNAVQNYAIQANRRYLDGVTNSTTTFTSATASFVAGDASKPIRIYKNDGTHLDTTISSVTNSTTIVLAANPSVSQTGLYFGIGPRDRNIHVRGGRWVRASNNLAPSSSLGYESNHLRFRQVDNVSVQDITINHVSGKYSVNFGDCTSFYVNHIVAEQTHSDMVHINGPSSFGVIKSVKSYGSNDDLVSLTGGDFGHDMEKMGDVMGDISDILIDGIAGTIGDDGVNGARAVLVLGGQSTAGHEFTLDHITIRDIDSALQAAPVMIGNDTQDLYTTGGNYGRIFVDNGINISPTGTNPDYFVRVDDSAAVQYLEVRSCVDAGTDDIYIQGGGPGVITLVTVSIDPARVIRDSSVTNYYNDFDVARLHVANTFTKVQTFHDAGGNISVEAYHMKVHPRSSGGSSSIFLDNDNGQQWEFFGNNGGSFGVFDGTYSKQPMTLDPNATASIKVSGGTFFVSNGGMNIGGDGNFNDHNINNVFSMNPGNDNEGSIGLSSYRYNNAYFTNTTINKLGIVTGSNASAGTGTLAAGTVTISTTAVTASSLIFLTDTTNSLTNLGILTVSSKTAGTSFTVKSSNVLDTSTFNWMIVN